MGLERGKWAFAWMLCACLACAGPTSEEGEPDGPSSPADGTASDTVTSSDTVVPGDGIAAVADAVSDAVVAPPCTIEIEGCTVQLCPSDDDWTAIQDALVAAAPKDVVCVGNGTYTLGKILQFAGPGVKLRGAGDATVLDFSEQLGGDSAILLKTNGSSVQSLQIRNPPGHGLMVQWVKKVDITGVSVVWTDGPAGGDGVQLREVFETRVKDSYVSGAAGSGVAVVDASFVEVSENTVEDCTAGVSVFNTSDVHINHNQLNRNAVGVALLHLPGEGSSPTSRVKVWTNDITGTNAADLESDSAVNAAPPDTVLGSLPAGVGVVLVAADGNEIVQNFITKNDTYGLLILSYQQAYGFAPLSVDIEYDRYSESNYSHLNQFEGNGHVANGIAAGFPVALPIPSMSWDGCVDSEKDDEDVALYNCFAENVDILVDPVTADEELADQGEARFVNLDFCNGFNQIAFQLGSYACEHAELPEILIEAQSGAEGPCGDDECSATESCATCPADCGVCTDAGGAEAPDAGAVSDDGG